MTDKRKALIGSTLSVTLIILFSKAIGFVREIIMAAYFGADSVTDAYNSAYSLFYLPVLLFSSCITSTLVPQYMKCEHDLGSSGADRFCSNTLTVFSLAALTVSGIMFAFSPLLVKIVYPGFSGETFALAVTLTRIMIPALVFFAAGLVLSSMLNSREKYVAAQLTGLPLSVAEIYAAVFLSRQYGINAQAWGVIAAGFMQVIILFPFLKGFKFKPRVDFSDVYFRRLLTLAVPAVLSMAVNELNHMIDRMLASGLNSGDITAMTYAFKLIMFMMGVLVVPLTTVSFSKMSKQAKSDSPELIVPQIRESIKLLLTAVLPLVIIAAVESRYIISFAYGRGRFTDENVYVTGLVFLFYVIGVPFFGLRDLVNRVFHAFEDTKTPMYIAVISVIINIILNLILRRIMGVNGLALATGIAALAGVICLFYRLTKLIPGIFSPDFVREILKIIVNQIPVFAVSTILHLALGETISAPRVFLRLALITASSLIVYTAFTLVTGGKTTLKHIISRFKR